MTNKKLGWLSGMTMMVATIAAGVMANSLNSQADTEWEIAPATAQAGVQVAIGQCPCFRWQVQAKALSGKYETQDILISTDALFQYSQTNSVNFQQLASRLYTVGAVEALVKGGHVGVGFNGVQWGEDKDRGYSSLLRTGFYMLANIIQQDGLRLDAHAGYDWDHFVNLVGLSGTRGLFDSAVALHWDSGPWSGMVNAHVGLETDSNFFNPHNIVAGATANVRARVVSFSDFEMGLTAQVSAEHDGFRDMLGLNPNNAIASLLMDISWVERDHTN
jgi:hypothetical protein